SVGKIRQDYKITLPKTTYPINGTLTIKEMDESKGTGNKKTFTITSVPVYENTIYKPVLVRGKYSGQEEGEDEDRYWAPVNVGASSTTYSATVAGCGYYFQWGRNVPFVYGSSNNTYGGPVYPETPVEDYENKFITSASDWLSDPDDGLWSGDNAQGPCPDGWRVPTAVELTVLKDKISTITNCVTISGAVNGEYLYLPVTGDRSVTGTWANQSSAGCYWSSTVSDTGAIRLLFYGTNMSSVSEFGRASGNTVRCIQK
ncbi:MAG: fibrobacter succinogenes major paralogous domain-containing protein, partial [Prevotella sp.]|nr:fibrobacter succinogenes major paralogous domain-containing protein [Prevotella sp.]